MIKCFLLNYISFFYLVKVFITALLRLLFSEFRKIMKNIFLSSKFKKFQETVSI